MKCPACGGTLTLMTAGQIIVSVCEMGCGGMWFDQLELKRLDEPHESEGEQLLQVLIRERIGEIPYVEIHSLLSNRLRHHDHSDPRSGPCRHR